MCGIFIALSKTNALSKKICFDSIKDLFNRGPDILKTNYFLNNTLFIANTVLSITGKLNKSKNLVSSQNKNFFISFNGEIYNYKLLNDTYINEKRFETDTEVLVNLHQKLKFDKIPSILNGMFSYAVLDFKKKQIKIATDPQGEKNIYYYNDSKYFVVSSTIKSIILFLKKNEINLEIDQTVIKDYFSTRHYMPVGNTCFKKLRILNNANILEINLRNYQLNKKCYENPINWISEKEYNAYLKMSEDEVLEKLDFELNTQAKLMIPKKNFGCVFSGGIDSSLQSAILSKHGNPHMLLNINHINKDKIHRRFNIFEKYIQRKIKIKKIDRSKYIDFADKCSSVLSSPFFTHDLPSRMILSQEFKKNNCKVFFGADGCDELLGGQQIYLKSFKNLKKSMNNSPYSSASKESFFLKNYKTSQKYREILNRNWLKSLQKYSFIKNKSERNILASLFCDYFVQSVNVANKSTDLICCDNSVEPRNIFIQKNIIKLFINLPLKYKINYSVSDNLKQKYILKKLFIKYFDKKMIFKKEGFSGFPEALHKKNFELNKYLKDIEVLQKSLSYYDQQNYDRDLNWKISNIEIFIKKNYNFISHD
jgi:asparagine synthase (glutamine-hydrolysing)